MNSKKITLLTIVVIAALFAVAKIFWKPQPAPSAAPTTQPSATLVKAYSPKMGSDMARVQIVEFLDPECEACAAFYPIVKKIVKDYPQQIQLVVRYMLFHNNSKLAAQATEAAGKQGKYWEMQETLFTRKEWTHQDTPQTALFEKYAQELGLNLDQFRTDMKDAQLEKNIATDFSEGPSLGVEGTPTFFINGQKLLDFSEQGLRSAVDAELKK